MSEVTAHDGDQVVTGAALAAVLGFRPSYLVELKHAGRLVPGPGGKGYWRAASLARYAQTRDPAAQAVADRHAAARGDGEASAPASAGEGDADRYLQADEASAVRRARALADQAEADVRKKLRDEQVELGRLLDADEVESIVASAATGIRVGLERLADSLAPALAAQGDEAKCRQLLWDEFNHLLDELARDFRKIGKGPAA